MIDRCCVFVEDERNESSNGLTKAGCDVVVVLVVVVTVVVVDNAPTVVVIVGGSLLLGTWTPWDSGGDLCAI